MGFGVLAAAFTVIGIAVKAWTIIQGFQTAAQTANNVAWYASPVTWIIIAIIAALVLLVAAAIWLWQNWDGVTKWIGEAWANMCNFIRIIGDAISKWWGDLWGGIGLFFSTIWNGLSDIVGNVWGFIIGFIESGVNNVVALINGIINGINAVGGVTGIHLTLIPDVNIPRLASGGLVTRSTFAQIGEAGPEAILPLNSPLVRNILGGSNNDGPLDLTDSTIDKLARALASYTRVQARQGIIL